jgi:uncharacterized integral membrane protein
MESTAYDPRIGTSADPSYRATTRPTHEGRTLGALFGDLWRQTTTLVHEEAELAKADMSEKVNQIATGAGSIAAGGAVLFAGLIILLLAASNGLALALPPEHSPWLAPLIVAILAMVIGYAIFAAGRKKLKAHNLTPSRSIDSLRRDGRIVKEHVQ